MLQQALDHPQKLYPIIGILVVLLIILYMKKIGDTQMKPAGTSYLGSSLHQATMAEAIEDVCRNVITKYPTLDDGEQARMVRDELRLRGLNNVDMYEATIFATVARLKGSHLS